MKSRVDIPFVEVFEKVDNPSGYVEYRRITGKEVYRYGYGDYVSWWEES